MIFSRMSRWNLDLACVFMYLECPEHNTLVCPTEWAHSHACPDMRFSDQDSSQAAGAVGLRGLLTRGLKAKLIFNCVQSVVFNVVWEKLQAMSR